PVAEEEAPPDLETLYAPETLVTEGEFAIFGTNRPELEISLSGKFDRMPIGKGKCAFCHIFVEGHNTDRCPDIRGIEVRSHERPKEARYKLFSEKYAEAAEPDSSFTPKAQTGGEYIIESIYCPSCYVVEGFGVAGSDGFVSKMPVMHHLPYEMSDYDIITATAYLQFMDTQDYSKITAPDDWQNYFKKDLPLPDGSPKIFASIESLAETEKLLDPIEVVMEKNGCFSCHKIPGIDRAQAGLIGPILAMKNVAARRLASPEYKQAVSEGRAKATTAREYIAESILRPDSFIVPGFRAGDGMPTDYERKMTLGDVENIVTYLLNIDESMVDEDDLVSPMGLDNAESVGGGGS
ncbi:MAG: c-type cytochrome, partial [Nitrospiria bacterium]